MGGRATASRGERRRPFGRAQPRARAARARPESHPALWRVHPGPLHLSYAQPHVRLGLRAQPLDDWPAFMAQMALEAPRWLYLERRSRAEFQRSFYREYDGLDYEVMKRLGREALNAVTLRRIYPEGMRRIREHKRAGHRVLLLTGALDVVVEPLAELLEVEVDCARLLVRDGRLTGDLESPPPAGEARGGLLEEYAGRNGVGLPDSFAYAESPSDLPMLELVGTPVAVNPDARPSQVAGQRGWRGEPGRAAAGNWRPPVPAPPRPADLEAARRGRNIPPPPRAA